MNDIIDDNIRAAKEVENMNKLLDQMLEDLGLKIKETPDGFYISKKYVSNLMEEKPVYLGGDGEFYSTASYKTNRLDWYEVVIELYRDFFGDNKRTTTQTAKAPEPTQDERTIQTLCKIIKSQEQHIKELKECLNVFLPLVSK